MLVYLIHLTDWNSCFRIKDASGLEYSEMLFFDDEIRNKYDLDKIGVLMILINERDGVTKSVIKKGLKEFAQRNQ